MYDSYHLLSARIIDTPIHAFSQKSEPIGNTQNKSSSAKGISTRAAQQQVVYPFACGYAVDDKSLVPSLSDCER
jgi:hypothetical protein